MPQFGIRHSTFAIPSSRLPRNAGTRRSFQYGSSRREEALTFIGHSPFEIRHLIRASLPVCRAGTGRPRLLQGLRLFHRQWLWLWGNTLVSRKSVMRPALVARNQVVKRSGHGQGRDSKRIQCGNGFPSRKSPQNIIRTPAMELSARSREQSTNG